MKFIYFFGYFVEKLPYNDMLFFLFNLGVSQTPEEAQTNLQGEVQPTDRPSLRIFK